MSSIYDVFNGNPTSANPSAAIEIFYSRKKQSNITLVLTGADAIRAQVNIEVSMDGVSWITSAADTNLEVLLVSSRGNAQESVILLSDWRYLRIKATEIQGTVGNLKVVAVTDFNEFYRPWHDDHGRTKNPTIFIPMNECEAATKTNIVPCRVGRSVLFYNTSSSPVLNSTSKTLSFPAGTGSDKFIFDHADSGSVGVGPSSLHYKVLSPKHNIGKHIVIAIKAKVTANPSETFNVIQFNPFSYNQKGGFNFRVQTWEGERYATFGLWAANVADPSVIVQTTRQTGVVEQQWESGEYTDWILILSPLSESSLKVRMYAVKQNGDEIKSGNALFNRDFEVDIPDFHFNGRSLTIGNGELAFEAKDFIAYVDDIEPEGEGGSLNLLRAWRASASNDYQFPEFLREVYAPPLTIPQYSSTREESGNYCSYWSINGISFSINSHYDFWFRWGVQDSAFTGVHIGLGVNAFQPSRGEFKSQDLASLADWLGSRGANLKLLVNDQTYVTKSEIPSWFPQWNKTYNNGVETDAYPVRIVPYWWSIDDFDVDAWINDPESYLTLPVDKQEDATWVWFNHVLNIIWSVKDKPAFSGITLGETSGYAFGVDSNNNPNDPNDPAKKISRYGIYQITDATGAVLMNRCYSMRKYRVYLEKMFKLVASVLSHRQEIVKSLQINFIRSSIPGTVGDFSFSGNTITRGAGWARPNNTPCFVVLGSSNTLGLARDTLYYTVNSNGTNSFQLSLTPNGTPVTLNGSGTVELYIGSIDYYIEVVRDGQRTLSNVNGYMLQDQNREMVYIHTAMKKHGFITSGPDVIERGLEVNTFGAGGTASGNPAEISVVELRLQMQKGQGWFREAGPLSGAEIQSQDSMYGVYVGSGNFATAIDMYGPRSPKNSAYPSMEQAVMYAFKRLHAQEVVWFTNQAYFSGVDNSGLLALPDLLDALQKIDLQ